MFHDDCSESLALYEIMRKNIVESGLVTNDNVVLALCMLDT
jgi:hypothetical protein